MDKVRGETTQPIRFGRLAWRYGLAVAVFEVFFLALIDSTPAFKVYLGAMARAATLPLKLLSNTASCAQEHIYMAGTSITVASGCDGIEPLALVVLGMLVFPASPGRKVVGVGVACTCVLGANALRLSILMVAYAYWPQTFEALHVALLPFVLAIVAVVVFGVWTKGAIARQPCGGD